jgi:general secretion pathway protein H
LELDHFVDKKNERLSLKGFTLIEVMVVMAIVAFIIVIGATRLSNPKDGYTSFVQRLAVSTRELRNTARLKNLTTRLAIEMDKKNGTTVASESAQGLVPVLSEEAQKAVSNLSKEQQKIFMKKFTFEPEKSAFKKPLKLPKGLKIESVEYSGRDRLITEGTAYIHFFPQGLSDEAAIVVTNGDTLFWTIMVNPLTGRADVFEKKMSMKELKNQ